MIGCGCLARCRWAFDECRPRPVCSRPSMRAITPATRLVSSPSGSSLSASVGMFLSLVDLVVFQQVVWPRRDCGAQDPGHLARWQNCSHFSALALSVNSMAMASSAGNAFLSASAASLKLGVGRFLVPKAKHHSAQSLVCRGVFESSLINASSFARASVQSLRPSSARAPPV